MADLKNILFTPIFYSLTVCFIISLTADSCKKSITATPPILSTIQISNVAASSVTSGGIINSDGGAPITARGVCWSTSTVPTTSDSKTFDGNGTGKFVSIVGGLNNATTYHLRAYAINSASTAYGADVIFSTIATLPIITTSAISKITPTSALCGGNISDNGGATITTRGVCWSTCFEPTVTDNKTTDGSGLGTFKSSMVGLSVATNYHVRAYATNSVGTSYGSDIVFSTNSLIPSLNVASVSGIVIAQLFWGEYYH